MVLGAFRGWVRIVRGGARSRASQLIRGVRPTKITTPVPRVLAAGRERLGRHNRLSYLTHWPARNPVVWPGGRRLRAATARSGALGSVRGS